MYNPLFAALARLFDDAIDNSESVASNDGMINEKEIRKYVAEIVVTYFEILSHLPEGLRKNTKYRG
jgi:hypothetical protein